MAGSTPAATRGSSQSTQHQVRELSNKVLAAAAVALISLDESVDAGLLRHTELPVRGNGWKAFAHGGLWKQAPRVIKLDAAGPLPPSGA